MIELGQVRGSGRFPEIIDLARLTYTQSMTGPHQQADTYLVLKQKAERPGEGGWQSPITDYIFMRYKTQPLLCGFFNTRAKMSGKPFISLAE